MTTTTTVTVAAMTITTTSMNITTPMNTSIIMSMGMNTTTTSWGRETPRKYSREELQEALSALAMGEDYGYILRAKGMVPCDDGQTWLHFDLVPEEFQIREGGADYTGRLCVIGSELKEDQLEKLFLLA